LKTYYGAKGLVLNGNGQALLLRRSKSDKIRPGDFDLPGGRTESGELITSTFAREVKEETGLTIQDVIIVRANSAIVEGTNRVWLFCIARTMHTEVVLSHEHDAYEWHTLPELRDLMQYSHIKDHITYVLMNNLAEGYTKA
jgi:8-oxo-dGTP pyrophosphatase MutT (NUDIX family)